MLTQTYIKYLKIDFFTFDLQDMLSGKIGIKGAIRKKRFRNRELLKCKECDLVNECRKPVLPSLGLSNVVIVGEAPGFEEDKSGEGFIGKAGDLLWTETERFDYYRQDFHVTNINKCFPKISRTPTKEQVDVCSKWFVEELKELKSRVILSLGANAYYFFTGNESGITTVSGKIEWVEKVPAWVCYCVHPAWVLRDRKSNMKKFRDSLKEFFNLVERMGGIE